MSPDRSSTTGEPGLPSTIGVVLAGGFGTRLRSVRSDLPKPMFPCAGEPFLEWVLRHLAKQGIEKCLVSVCHLKESIEAFIEKRTDTDLKTACIAESTPLGTGGAIRWTWANVSTSPICVVNGDSLLLADWEPARRRFSDDAVDGVLIGLPMEDASRYGTLKVDDNGRLLSFCEKQQGSGLINAGVYFLKPSLFNDFPTDAACSIERDIFPAMLKRGRRIEVATVDGPFLDIGLPDTFDAADAFLQSHWCEEQLP